MNPRALRSAVLGVALAAAPSSAPSGALPGASSAPSSAALDAGFEAEYALGIPDKIVGVVSVSVSRRHDDLLYRGETRPQGVLGTLMTMNATLVTRSRARRTDGRLQPVEYQYDVEGRPEKKRRLAFDWHRRRVAGEHRGQHYELALEDGALDENTWQLQLIEDAAAAAAAGETLDRRYRIVAKGKSKTRRFVETGGEEIETAFGRVACVRVDRIRRGKTDRVLWLSPRHHYLPLVIEKVDDGRVRQRLSMRTLRLHGARGARGGAQKPE